MNDAIVIVGGGHAAAQLCSALAEAGQGARVHLVMEEGTLPYQRPPLSKSYLKDAAETLQLHRDAQWFATHGITLHHEALDDPTRHLTTPAKPPTQIGQAILKLQDILDDLSHVVRSAAHREPPLW